MVEYYVYNRDQDKIVRRRFSGFNRIKTVRARKAAARELMQQIDELLRQGYTEGSQETLSNSLAFLQESRYKGAFVPLYRTRVALRYLLKVNYLLNFLLQDLLRNQHSG